MDLIGGETSENSEMAKKAKNFFFLCALLLGSLG
jgi:hypothetical protein